MNFLVVFSRMRGMLVGVEQTATAMEKETGQTTVCGRGSISQTDATDLT
jgi:hypothetical protein